MNARLYRAFILIVFIPLVVVNLLLLRLFSQEAERSTTYFATQLVRAAALQVDTVLANYERLSMQLYYRHGAIDQIAEVACCDHELHPHLAMEALQAIVNHDRYITAAYVYTGSRLLVTGVEYQHILDVVTPYLERARGARGRITFTGVKNMRNVYGQDHEVIFAIRQLRSAEGQVGYLVYAVRVEVFADLYGELARHSSNVVVFDEYGSLVYQHLSIPGLDIPVSLVRTVLAARSGARRADIGDESMLVVHDYARVPNWTLVNATPRRMLFADTTAAINIALMLVGVSVVFLGVVSFFLSRRLVRPIADLRSALSTISAGNFDVRIPRAGVRELDELIDHTHEMADRISGLIQAVRDEEDAKREAEMRALRMQVSPHFLYNTLNTIRWIAQANKQRNIQEMTSSLMELMKSASKGAHSMVPLSDELDLLRHYLAIQRVRYGHFAFETDVPSELLSLKVIKFLTQGIVENSIVHGIRSDSDALTVTFSARVDGDGTLRLRIQDNGVGFHVEELGQCTCDDLARTGIQTARDRIRLHHGDGFGLSIVSAPGNGTSVEFVLPVVRE